MRARPSSGRAWRIEWAVQNALAVNLENKYQTCLTLSAQFPFHCFPSGAARISARSAGSNSIELAKRGADCRFRRGCHAGTRFARFWNPPSIRFAPVHRSVAVWNSLPKLRHDNQLRSPDARPVCGGFPRKPGCFAPRIRLRLAHSLVRAQRLLCPNVLDQATGTCRDRLLWQRVGSCPHPMVRPRVFPLVYVRLLTLA
jgi:hypothetical protein